MARRSTRAARPKAGAPAARPLRGGVEEALPPSPVAALLPPASHRPNVLESALDVLAVPIGIVLMAVLAPVSAVLAPRKKA